MRLSVRRRALFALGLAAALVAPALAAAQALPGDMTLGDPKAKVTVVEYASVGCPVCARWGKETWPAFKAKYVDTGKVHFVYREMLVGDTSEQAMAAAGFVLARCAGPAKYFDVVEAVYRDQEAIYRDARKGFGAVAKEAGLPDDRFKACLSDDAAFNALYKRVEENAKAGHVNATPTFVVNGKGLEPGAQPLEVLDKAIAAALAAPPKRG